MSFLSPDNRDLMRQGTVAATLPYANTPHDVQMRLTAIIKAYRRQAENESLYSQALMKDLTHDLFAGLWLTSDFLEDTKP